MQALSDVFRDRIINSDILPARSPDFDPCDIFFWGCLKDKVYNSNPRAEELKENIRREISNIPAEQLLISSAKFCMRLAAGGAPVAVKRRIVNRSTKVRTSLYNLSC
jgi:hypothetical protein